jgi:hypothetical protein
MPFRVQGLTTPYNAGDEAGASDAEVRRSQQGSWADAAPIDLADSCAISLTCLLHHAHGNFRRCDRPHATTADGLAHCVDVANGAHAADRLGTSRTLPTDISGSDVALAGCASCSGGRLTRHFNHSVVPHTPEEDGYYLTSLSVPSIIVLSL